MEITDITPATVTYEDNHGWLNPGFLVPVGTTEFSFKDNGVNKVGQLIGVNWHVGLWASVTNPPFDLESEAQSDSEIKLTWEHDDFSANGISIERSADAITYSEIATVPVTAFEYTDNDIALEEDARYWYRLRFYKDNDYSEYSVGTDEWTNYSPDYHAFVIRTDNSGDTDDNEYVFTASGENYDVKWERGGEWQTGLTTEWDAVAPTGGDPDLRPIVHTYSTPGIYRILVRGGLKQIRYYLAERRDYQKLLEIQQWGNIAWSTMTMSYMYCRRMDLTAKDTPNFSMISSAGGIAYMFYECDDLVGDTANWDWNTTGVRRFQRCFKNAPKVNPDVTGWDMSGGSISNAYLKMFEGSDLNRDLSGWTINTLMTDMEAIFKAANMSIVNYTRTLIGLANSVYANSGPYDVNFTDQIGMVYDDAVHNDIAGQFNTASSALAYLEDTVANGGAGWTISGHAQYIPRDATTFYVANTGNDLNDGESEESPWATIEKVKSTYLIPGDEVLFKAGDEWNDVPYITHSGDNNNQIYFGQYGEGAKPKFTGMRDVTGWDVAANWTDQGGDVWSIVIGGSTRRRIWIDAGTGLEERERSRYDAAGVGITSDYQWQITGGTLYVYSIGNPATTYTAMRMTSGSKVIGHEADYITFNNLDIEGWEEIELRGCSYPIIEYCDIGKNTTNHGLHITRSGEKYSSNGIIRHCNFDSNYPFFVVRIEGVDTETWIYEGTVNAIRMRNGGFKDWDIHNNNFAGWGYTCFTFTNPYENGFLTEGIKFHDNTYSGVGLNYGRAFGGHQYLTQTNENNPIEIYRNTFYSQAVQSQIGCAFIKVYNNIFNGAIGPDSNGSITSANALSLFNYEGRPPYKTKIYNNVFAHCGYAAMFTALRDRPENFEDIEFVNNILYNNGEHNSWIQWHINDFVHTCAFINPKIDNNIFWADNEANIVSVLSTQMNVDNFNALDGIYGQANNQELRPSNNVQANPLFVDPANGDFRLQAASPAIGAGLTPLSDTDKDGNPWAVNPSIGAFEYQE